jgi:adenine-specific DNA methylase
LPYRIDNEDLLPTVDKLMRKKENIDNILQVTNQHILKNGYGFTDKEIILAANIWKKLSRRRLNRGNK